MLEQDTAGSPTGGSSKFVALTVVAAIGLGIWYLSSSRDNEEPQALDAPPPPTVVEDSASEEAVDVPRKKRAEPIGALVVTGGVEGADVSVSGTVVGQLPYVYSDLNVGRYEVKVSQDGYKPYVEIVRVRSGQQTKLEVELERLPPWLRVSSDVPGSTVFLNRNYKGATPLVIEDLGPGEHQLTVSADGYEIYATRIRMGDNNQELKVSLAKKGESLDVAATVVHKHRFGKCEGRLVADQRGIRFETNHKDAFTVEFSSIENFEFDYLKRHMNLKVRRGKNYNFTAPDEDADPLFLFHKQVTEFTGGQ